MIKIIIEHDDAFFRLAIEELLNQIFINQLEKPTFMPNEVGTRSIALADMIIMEFKPGEIFICHPALHTRKKNSLIIGVYDNASKLRAIGLPLCFKDMILINRSEALSRIKQKIITGWESCRHKNLTANNWNCRDCGHKTFSTQQIRFIKLYYYGTAIEEIAQSLDISQKTVYAHKRMIMHKFGLRTDYELLTLLNVLKRLKYSFNVGHTSI